MKQKKEIPVYLVCGFLDAGKTEFLKSVLTPDGLADGSRTLLFRCEEGEEEYDEQALKKRNVVLVPIEEQEELTTQLLLDCEKKYRPEQVIFEYNGMWSMEELDREILPEHWILYQIVHVVESPTFQMYAQNMASLMMEKLRNADMIIFNRCNDELKEVLRKRNIKMLNRRASIYLEFEDGSTEDYDSGVPPFDMSREALELSDADHGIWDTDVQAHPARYEGKKVRYRGMVAKSDKFPAGSFVAGRFAMVCCAQDTTFLGMICFSPDVDRVKTRDWVWVTGEVRQEYVKLYNGDGPVLHTLSVEPADPPEEELVYF